jgi:hypothetical protein
MSLFTNQLITLIATLEAVTEKKSFDMTNWYREKSRDVVDCGFAACICGHQAVAEKSEFFDVDVHNCFSDAAGEIADSLSDSCNDVFGNDFLASAIYEGEEDNRTDAALFSKLFTRTELKHPHLTKEYPTIKQAISFLELCIKKVEAAK